MPLFRTGLLIVLITFSAACAGKDVPSPSVAPVSVAPAPIAPAPAAAEPAPASVPGQIYRETGIAAWYGRELHGKKTASGETFDMNALSAAHRTLPFGTLLRVTNLDNFKSITVKVIDRGPFDRSRVLELSYGASRELGFVSQGTARVRIETSEPVRDPAVYTVQAANFTEEENAKLLKERLSKKFEVVSIVTFETNLARFYRVRVGSYSSEERAEQVAGKLTLEGLEPVVMRKD
jgi:rare lipoprotein A